MRQEPENSKAIANADDDDLLADVGQDDVVGTADAIAAAVDPDHDRQLAAERRRAHVERQAILVADDEVAVVPAIVVLQAGRGLGRATRRTPRQAVTGCGGFQRTSPTGARRRECRGTACCRSSACPRTRPPSTSTTCARPAQKQQAPSKRRQQEAMLGLIRRAWLALTRRLVRPIFRCQSSPHGLRGEQACSNSGKVAGVTGAFVIVTCLFFAWGFITSLIDPLVAAVKGIFALSRRSRRSSSPSPSSSPTA